MERHESGQSSLHNGARITPITEAIASRHIKAYQLLGEELDAIAGGAHSIHLTLFGISIGALAAFAGFVGASVAAFGLSTLFGLLALRDWRRHQALLSNIKQARRRAG